MFKVLWDTDQRACYLPAGYPTKTVAEVAGGAWLVGCRTADPSAPADRYGYEVVEIEPCPVCGGQADRTGDGFHCRNCGHEFVASDETSVEESSEK